VKKNTQQAHNWDWLADPDAALELYSTERKAFYAWQAAECEWSEATREIASTDRSKMTKDQRDSLDALEKRLNETAEAYERARQQLHEAWSA
jgi:hypothetical protein